MGRPRMIWVKAVESDMRVKGLIREDAEEQKANSYNSRKNSLKTSVIVVVVVVVVCYCSGVYTIIIPDSIYIK